MTIWVNKVTNHNNKLFQNKRKTRQTFWVHVKSTNFSFAFASAVTCFSGSTTYRRRHGVGMLKNNTVCNCKNQIEKLHNIQYLYKQVFKNLSSPTHVWFFCL